MEAVLEPGLCDDRITARNRLHHGTGGPARLIGPHRDPDLFAANNPANRAIRNAGRIRERDLAVFIETGDDDFINVHDGAEFLHRVLWDLDISHEYARRRSRGADADSAHAGDVCIARVRAECTVAVGGAGRTRGGRPGFAIQPGVRQAAQGTNGAGAEIGRGIRCDNPSALRCAGPVAHALAPL